MKEALEALGEADFSWAKPLESIWRDADAILSGPNDALEDDLVANFIRETKEASRKPPWRVLIGPAGIGKTHLIGNLRRKIWAKNGWFVLLDVIGITDFWKSAALSFLTSLLQPMPDGRRQLEAVITEIARRLNVGSKDGAVSQVLHADGKSIVDLLLPGLASIDFMKAYQHKDVFKALALLRAQDLDAVGVAHNWLQGYEVDEQTRKASGLTKPPPAPIELVRGMSWLMSLAGPTLIAVDQVDGVISAGGVAVQTDKFMEQKCFGDLLSAGMLQLYDTVTRSQTVITCLPDSWEILGQGLKPAIERFQTPAALKPMTETEAICALIKSRLSPAYAAAGYTPSSSIWPFTEAAINSASGLMPRKILMACDHHRRRCLAAGSIELCNSLISGDSTSPETVNDFDQKYQAAKEAARIDDILDDKDDGKIGRLLRDVFDLYASQIEPHDNIDVISQGDPAQKMPPLHGRLTFVFRDQKDREAHFCFRAIEHANAMAFSARMRAALTSSGIGYGIKDRRLFIVRRKPIPNGRTCSGLHGSFIAAGGKMLDPTDDDLKSFVALCDVRNKAVTDGQLAEFESWLRKRSPLCETPFFKAAGLCPPPGLPPREKPIGIRNEQDKIVGKEIAGVTDPPIVEPPLVNVPPAPPISVETGIPIGKRIGLDDKPVELPTQLLPRHTAIIAGAGSGKTVLLRRLVEEAALAGIPAIVIDPNNDLSRLGEAWPERPSSFTAEDDAKARRYFETVEVVIWTPGVQAGNPLFLSVLPDFAAIGEDPDERAQAVEMAAATLAPLAGAKKNLPKGVLADALRHFAAKGGGGLKDMIALLADLPEGVSDIGKAEQLAAKMADELKAAIATNPLLKGSGPVLDPKLLFSGNHKNRTRISVINLSGLASNEAKEDFINRLQMTLFGWVKKHPSPKGMLYVIDEAQTFIPSGEGALSKTSGRQLVAQARKYGLGMIAVTQAPKGIDNKVVSNCTTQFLGKQNSPADQQSVKEMITATGGSADDIGKLGTGEFYFKTEKSGKPFKLRTPVCLSYHPPNPPTPEEVLIKAKKSADLGSA